MTALPLHHPTLAADHIEWQLLHEGIAEFSRGDLDPASAWAVQPEDSTEEDVDVMNVASTTHSAKVDDTLNHIAYRCASFKGVYALQIDKGIVRRVDPPVSADAELVYRFLLACSRPETSQALGDTFTELCKLALFRFFGGRASVWNIDARSPDRQQMGKTTPKVVEFLAPRIGARVKKLPHSQLADQGDGGCDLIAAFEFNDQALGHLTFLGQCAASSSATYWRNKSAEPRRFAHNYELVSPPQICMFIPYVYRSTDGSWENEANCSEVVMFDRGRILAALDLERQPLPSDLGKLLTDAMKSALAKSASKTARKAKAANKSAARLAATPAKAAVTSNPRVARPAPTHTAKGAQSARRVKPRSGR